MTNADWWNQVAASRTESDSHTIMPAWTLRRDGHEAALALRRIANIGTEVVLLVDGDLRRTRLFRSHEDAELRKAIEDTRAKFEAKGWR